MFALLLMLYFKLSFEIRIDIVIQKNVLLHAINIIDFIHTFVFILLRFLISLLHLLHNIHYTYSLCEINNNNNSFNTVTLIEYAVLDNKHTE